MSRSGLFLAALSALGLAIGISAAPAAAATTVGPVSNLRVYGRYDHTIRVAWSMPAVHTSAAVVIVRMTRGRTAAASPSAGYAVPIPYRTYAEARPLTASAVYTFAVWVRDRAGLSARRTLTTSTPADVTPPHDLVTIARTERIVDARTVSATLHLTSADDPDIAGVRIVRNEARTTAGGAVSFVSGRPTAVTFSLPRGTNVYIWALPRDTTGHYAAHYRAVGVNTTLYRISGRFTAGTGVSNPTPGVTDLSGNPTDATDYGADVTTGTWYQYVNPGRYTVCQSADNAPGQHFDYVAGCWTPQGTQDYTSSGPPAAAIGAVDARSGAVTGVDLELNYF